MTPRRPDLLWFDLVPYLHQRENGVVHGVPFSVHGLREVLEGFLLEGAENLPV